jgi:glyoxylase-like metal-dependent hydrolase (beta-lactamase superfamily II)
VIDYPWPVPPAMGGTAQVAAGVRWLRMPLPFRLDHINLWLLEDEGGWAVVDTGIGLGDTRALWERLFDEGLDGKPVTRVVVTHFHPDHMGNAHWIVERFGVDLWCTQAEWLTARLASRGAMSIEQRMTYYRRNGVGEDGLQSLRGRAHQYTQVVPSVAPDFRCLRDGDRLCIGGRDWEVLTTFGHSPEQACLHTRDGDLLISADQILPKITTNVSVWPDQPHGDPLRLYLASLERFKPMDADTLALPSHGLPFRGLPARLDALRVHHDERLARALTALGKPKTAADVMPILFDRALDLQQLGFAIGETLAHLHYLEAERRVRRVVGADGLHRFVRA